MPIRLASSLALSSQPHERTHLDHRLDLAGPESSNRLEGVRRTPISVLRTQFVCDRHVFVYQRKAADLVQERVIRIVIIHRGDLPAQRSTRSRLRPKLMIQIWSQRDGLTGPQYERMSG